MEQITGLLWLILGNQTEDGYWKVWCCVMSILYFVLGFMQSPITQGFIKGLKG